MNILHVTAHLGGGVGKAHAALTAAMPFPARQGFLLLEKFRAKVRINPNVPAPGGLKRMPQVAAE